MTQQDRKRAQAIRRRKRVRSSGRGTADRPRLSMFRSNYHLSAQIIDDAAGVTLVSARDTELATEKKVKKIETGRRQDRAVLLGEHLAGKAKAKGIRTVVFDRGSYRYHGLAAALAQGARRGGLKF